ncbi:MAG TPA: hypothetical protein PK777_10035, partial [Thermoguttaceae bacterium]|nr:hypothetical protein [Thermoguttaceae bacterium]
MDVLATHRSDAAPPNSQEKLTYLLSVDLGVLSLGWAALELQEGEPIGLLDAGVRSWELLTAAETDIEKGQEEPPGQQRRQTRQMRR